MLHLIFQSSGDLVVLERLGSGDDLVFQGSAIWNTMDGHFMNTKLRQLIDKNCRVHVLEEELDVNGIAEAQLLSGVLAIDYSGLVELTVKNKVIKTWR